MHVLRAQKSRPKAERLFSRFSAFCRNASFAKARFSQVACVLRFSRTSRYAGAEGFGKAIGGERHFGTPKKVFARRFLFGRNQEDMRSRHSVECRTVRSSALGAQAVRRALMRAETLPRSARPFTRGFTRAMTLPMAAMPVRPTAAVASSMITAISSSVSA